MAKKTSKLTKGEKAKITRWLHQDMPLREIAERVNVTVTKIKEHHSQLMKKECDELWRKIIVLKAGGVCEITGQPGEMNAHHLLEKGAFHKFRYDLNNGMCLHKDIHMYDPDISPHYSSASREMFRLRLMEDKPKQYAWWDENRENKKFVDIDYFKVYEELSEILNGLI